MNEGCKADNVFQWQDNLQHTRINHGNLLGFSCFTLSQYNYSRVHSPPLFCHTHQPLPLGKLRPYSSSECTGIVNVYQCWITIDADAASATVYILYL